VRLRSRFGAGVPETVTARQALHPNSV